MAIAIAGLTSALVLGVAIAGAQVPDTPTVPDPYATGEGVVRDNPQIPDTDVTPQGDETGGPWKLDQGARWGEDHAVPGSVTDFRDSLYSVAFRNTTKGFAGGARTIDCDGQPTEVPVMYRHDNSGGTGLHWSLDFVGDCDHPGFVGAIAWTRESNAVAVGGTGSYPKREPKYEERCQIGERDPNTGEFHPTEAYGVLCDPAGDARAWQLSSNSWREFTDDLPRGREGEPPRGMTALAFSPTRNGFGFAGGLGQIWRWQGGGLDKLYDLHSPCPRTETKVDASNTAAPYALGGAVQHSCEFAHAYRFRFRVRDLAFHYADPPTVFAVTDGCCAEDSLHDSPNLLAYTETSFYTDTAGPRWYAATLDPLSSTVLDEDAGISSSQGSVKEGSLGLSDLDARRLNERQDLPDSYYSLTVGGKTHAVPVVGARLSVVAASGGPEGSEPERSLISQPYCASFVGRHTTTYDDQVLDDRAIEALRTRLSSARLVAGDGDVANSFVAGPSISDLTVGNEELAGGPGEAASGRQGCGNTNGDRTDSDGVPDWAVGELPSTKTELGDRGIAYSTVTRPELLPTTVDPNPDLNKLLAQELPTDEGKLATYLRSQLLLLDSYALNAIDVIDPTGTGWAVGERGGIVRLGGSGGAAGAGGSEPDPPRLPTHSAAPVPSSGVYAAAQPPAAGDPGPVPELATRPRLDLPEPRMFAAGSPLPAADQDRDPIEDVQQIVMSRDGSEGWAIGPSARFGGAGRPALTTVFRYDGENWSRCDPDGVEGQVPPDPACADLAPLRTQRDSYNRLRPVKLTAAARVPLEYDGDPSNDDELEIVAVTDANSADRSRPALARYRDGRWRVEPTPELSALIPGASTAMTLSYVGPNDAWLLASNNDIHTPLPTLLHFDGEQWQNCTPGGAAPAGCGDPGCPSQGSPGLLCFRPGDSFDFARGMASSGRDLFLYGSRERNGARYPFIIHRHAGGNWSAAPADGGSDPIAAARSGGPEPSSSEAGEVQSVGVGQGSGGAVEGWAVGAFSAQQVDANSVAGQRLGGTRVLLSAKTSLLRLGAGGWQPFDDTGPVADYLRPGLGGRGYCSPPPGACESSLAPTDFRLQLSLPPGTGGPTAIIAQQRDGQILGFYPDRGDGGRWQLIDQPRLPNPGFSGSGLDGPVKAIAPDGEGGIWAAIGDVSRRPHDDFEHFTSHPPAPVFTEAASPLRGGESFTSLAGAPDGTVWASTRSGDLLRYDRTLGWDRVSVPGWDPGRVVTRASRVLAVAVSPDDQGLAVGERGRIADLSLGQVRLDRAAGCKPPCGTGRDLNAAAVATGGSAIAGGDDMALLWRPEGGDFQAINPPEAAATDSITGLAMPWPGVAYSATESGQIFRGTGGAGAWSWVRENTNMNGDVVTLDGDGGSIALRAIGVDDSGHGYAVGDDGLILERVGSGEHAWERLRTPFAEDLTSVALPAGGGQGALIGGRNGLILTATGGRVSLARPADRFSNFGGITGSVVGFALLPGDHSGETEAWAATSGSDPDAAIGDYNASVSQLFHYSSDPSDPWLTPGGRASSLPDAPSPRSGELSFAAIGRAECRLVPQGHVPCKDAGGSADDHEVATKRAVAEIADRASRPGGPAFTLFSGDAVDTAGSPGTQESERQFPGAVGAGGGATAAQADAGPRKLRRFREAVSDPLALAGIPLFAASGGRDLSGSDVCYGTACFASTRGTAGDNLAWRQTFEGESGPWGGGDPPNAGSPAGEGLSFSGVADSSDAVRTQDQDLPDPDQGLPTGDGQLRAGKLGTGGASTHYALDISRGSEKIARLVVADTSLRSLQASDPLQQPAEPRGQLVWLDRMTCLAPGTASDSTPCTREPGQQAIVLTNTPTYSYGPGALSDTDTADGTQLEAILLQNRVSVVVAGRLGWNGLYYATAPGLHTPCAGGTYPTGPPTSTVPCAAGPDDTPDPVSTALGARQQACDAAHGAGAPDPTGCAAGVGEVLGRILPFVVASDVGGTFGPDGSGGGSASDGYWHGYTIVRLSPDGDPAKTVVEQRPVLDWVRIQPRRSQGDTHTVRAGKKLDLVGVGREPIAASTSGSRGMETRFDEISTPAITHRFDLLEADPNQPWLPAQGTRADDCDPYDCLSGSIATLDPQSGQVQARNGNYPRTFAIAALSVGRHSATYPLVFEPRASFRAPAPPPPAPVAVAPPASPPAPAQPTAPSVNLPAAPVLPVLTAQALAPPPVPPAPPTFASEAPLDLNLSPAALDATPPTAVSQPPTPPVNPAPPSGARREARQRQAAAQKSGADSEQGAESGREAADGGDLADGPASPGGNPMSRNDFTAIAERDQPSAWARDALLGGGLGIAALLLALGVSAARPTPRRRPPEVPAPAWARTRGARLRRR